MKNPKKSKEERKGDRRIVEDYHKKVTEDALEPLYLNFQEWKEGKLPYYELTEKIHEFHKTNQEIWKCLITMAGMMNFLFFRLKRN